MSVGNHQKLEDLQAALEYLTASKDVARREMQRLSGRYKNVDFQGKRVLDVGGGLGAVSYYAAAQGAREVVCLDPGDDGAHVHHDEASRRFQQAMPSDVVTFLPLKIQDYRPDGERFDIIIMSNSINHVDEAACVRLPHDPYAIKTYIAIFKHIAALQVPGGRLLVSDASPNNIYTRLGKNVPFAPNMEWHKHQPPKCWIGLMAHAGYDNFKVRWLALPRFGLFGKIVLSNKAGAYLTNSYFLIDCVLNHE